MVVTVWKQARKYSSKNGGPSLEHFNFLEGVETDLEIEFSCPEEAEIVLRSIKPEINGSPSDRTSVSVKINDSTLKIVIDAQDTASFRASLNSYLRWIKLSNEVINLKNESF
jgi:KEOPS complex subunit Pcc1